MALTQGIRRGVLVAWLLVIAAVVIPVVVRMASPAPGPGIVLVRADGSERAIHLAQVKRLPALTRKGTYQNQFGNWRDEGVYTGVLLSDLVGKDTDFTGIRVVATDGYEVTIDRARVLDPDYPVVLAYAFDGQEVPAWSDGFRTAVLPEDGSVSNKEYHAVSAGSYWVKNVARLVLLSD